jgi:hypothetical protein
VAGGWVDGVALAAGGAEKSLTDTVQTPDSRMTSKVTLLQETLDLDLSSLRRYAARTSDDGARV